MNEQYLNSVQNPMWNRNRNNSINSQEHSLLTRTTMLIQESKKQEGQSLKKIASLRAICQDSDKKEGRQRGSITIITTVRDKEEGDEETGFSQQTLSETFVSPEIVSSSSIVDIDQKSNQIQKRMSKYRLVPTYHSQQHNQNQPSNNLSSNNSSENNLQQNHQIPPFSFENELQLIVNQQQHFLYKEFLSKPRLFHLSNLSQNEQIECLLTKNSFAKYIDQIKGSSQLFQSEIAGFFHKKQLKDQLAIPSKLHKTCLDLSKQTHKQQSIMLIQSNMSSNTNFINMSKRNDQSIIQQLQIQVKSQQPQFPSEQLQLNSSCAQDACSSETSNIISVVEQFFKKHSIMKHEMIFQWIEEQISIRQPFDNYIHKFIYHKKYKDFETEEQKYLGISRFHNLNRMFMHNIIKILVKENMQQFNVPFSISSKISQIVTGIKNEAFKKYNNGKSKTCFFNHYHYNLLFLKINSQTLKLMIGSSKDKELHKSIMGVTLEGDSLNTLDVQYCNLIKHYIYQIVKTTIELNMQSKDYNNCVRLQYVHRVLNGIKRLSDGYSIKRF